ncbi:chemotaxis protein CheW [Pseudobacteriovorax antillogorgiicola]|uniref:Chemotaxis protein CheA n=1 Tax=Pseudobacteriovorax antillogorgiicola TaxID=1513793 RepID=A0A1Y6BUH0_9BACT|nr:chemotaxis protein CheW [Pseudobacteriovorax antillogorgiicola]TCS52366.1 two-component system chemotaxis sensor kinase CheA [Pseudobacteriovorax antillogorgiicola]SMF29411.1 two-component system, chemotaxis family, sensor kinase CheA [Pseudobacteriovorax antillogorgiicola]
MNSDTKVKILFVDDEIEIINPLAMEAEEQGFVALVAQNGIEGLELLNEHAESVALVFADYHMGEINGLEFRKRMLPELQSIPFIIYSGFVNKEMLRNALDLKVSRFIDKPFDVYRINAVIKEEAKDRIEQIEEKLTLKKIFVEEARDLLEDLENEILALESSPTPEAINNIFRLVHTIKGGSGVLEWPEFTRTVHSYEDLLSKIKNGALDATKPVVTVLLKGFDFVSTAISELEVGTKIDIDVDHWQGLFSIEESKQLNLATGDIDHGQAAAKKSEDDVIKVPTKILDEFMELSGEITVIRNTVNKLVSNLQKEFKGHADLYLLAEFLDEMHKINSSMQSKITELRKVSLKSIYRTFPRTVRDLNLSLGKQIDLKIVGDELRVDTKLAQVLKNSLIHVIRNSADHGIESPDDRASKSKSPKGVIELRSYELGDDVIVEVEDDGRGIDAQFISKRAVEKNLYSSSDVASMSDKQIYKIIMEAGFSTAAQVTDISGRGVGMDMVKSSVESIGGKIDIDSALGMGSKFSLKLPIPKSVMIIQSLLVRIGQREFNIPQDNIIRLIKIDQDKRDVMIKQAQGCELLCLDDHLVELIELSPELSPEDKNPIPLRQRSEINIVLARSEKLTFGMVVDEISDTEEIVVKKIPPQIKDQIFKGATFMGDGSVGLILDVDGIAEFYQLGESHQFDDTISGQELHQENHDGEEYIIFRLPARGLFCFHLDQIFRLEELHTRDFTKVAGRLSTIYRESVAPLTYVHEKLGIKPDYPLVEREKQTTIIIKDRDTFHGLIIDSIRDIKRINSSLDSELADRDEIEGSFIFNDEVVTVLDIYKLTGITPPEKHDHRVEDLGLQDDKQESDNEVEASGWGLF